MSQIHTIKFAAIQMQAILANVERNLETAQRLIREAAEQGADWIVLPEFFTSACAFHPKMTDSILPLDGEVASLFKKLSSELNVVIGGSFLAKQNKDVFNTFILVFPDGNICLHNKDIPTMWENCYYIGGHDDGVLKTSAGNVGVALCWEMLRSQTAKRLLGKVKFVLSGSCWWNLPESAPDKFNSLRIKSLELLKSAPVNFAKLLGVPVIHAGHAGNFEGFAAPSEEKKYISHYLGESMIVDSTGNVIENLTREDGEGIITADINLDVVHDPSTQISDEYWIPKMPKAFIAEWDRLNTFGKEYYQKSTRKFLKLS